MYCVIRKKNKQDPIFLDIFIWNCLFVYLSEFDLMAQEPGHPVVVDCAGFYYLVSAVPSLVFFSF
jgi:hypothetical protein